MSGSKTPTSSSKRDLDPLIISDFEFNSEPYGRKIGKFRVKDDFERKDVDVLESSECTCCMKKVVSHISTYAFVVELYADIHKWSQLHKHKNDEDFGSGTLCRSKTMEHYVVQNDVNDEDSCPDKRML
ncbi:hypothetical protein MTR_6g055793 [Medicago truncatula]|uniref:Uncharacterized protein n=1 Tax=Medicago truncatula TaxID=3880 RepID=A0A072UAH8_MEDTR|nr:hypothetical protein MTR_6g055793 [Medicago truncatula]